MMEREGKPDNILDPFNDRGIARGDEATDLYLRALIDVMTHLEHLHGALKVLAEHVEKHLPETLGGPGG